MKYLMPLLSNLILTSRSNNKDTGDFLKKMIRSEISAIGFKILTGIIIAFAVIYSLVQVAGAYKVFTYRYENGFVLELIGFGAVAIIGTLALYFLFNGVAAITKKRKQSVQVIPDIDSIQNVATQFVAGFMKGFESQKQIENSVEETGVMYDSSNVRKLSYKEAN